MFTLLGIALIGYVALAIHRGEVYGKDGMRGRTIDRHESPEEFWVMIVIYLALSVALMTVF